MATPAVAWSEVAGKDGASVQNFYGELFDWQINDAGDGSGYGLVAASENGIGGGIGSAQDAATDRSRSTSKSTTAAYLQKPERLGGQTIVAPTELEQFGLTFAFFTDPEGHLVGLSKGADQ